MNNETQIEYKKAIRHKPTQKWVGFGNDDSELSVRIIELVNFEDCFISSSRGYLDVLLTTSAFNGTSNYGVENYLDTNHTFVKAIFEKYGRNLVGGISGSAYYFYFLVFKILRQEKTRQNLINVLCIMILDYVPIWHSLEEILLTVSIEFAEFGFKEYKLDQDPMKYLKYVLGIASDSELEEGSQMFTV
jgi:hypothetical protein